MKLTTLIPMLSVSDLKRTMSFYGEQLGFDVLNSFGDPEPRWCMLGRDDVRIMFNQPPQDELDALPLRAKNFQVFYFYPDDVAALHAAWKKAGLPVSELRVTDYHMKEFELRDPDGYWLWFGQETSDPITGNA
jgi:catechol 2,3-dioxygenase-like lactoylglutathione lyase family enzyme